ncbi:MAG: response regulator [Verrucomicrobia bacterium]|nr:response regulator [Verrucomicrobiota bacterium]
MMSIIVVTSSAGLLLACAAFVTYELISVRQAMPRELSILTHVIGHDSMAALSFNDPRDAAQNLSALRVQPHIVRACIYDKDGQVFAEYVRDGKSGSKLFPPVEHQGSRFENNYLVMFDPMVLDGMPIGTVYIQSDLEAMHSRLLLYGEIAAAVLLASLLLSLFLSQRLQRVVTEPVLHLARATQVVSEKKDYSVRVARQSQDELGLLVDGFNQMLTQIQERDRALHEAREELEQRVEERTLELSKANTQLKEEIAERRRAEEEHQKLVALVENSNDFIGLATLDGEVLFLNEAGRKLVGQDQLAQVQGTRIIEYVPAQSQAQLRDEIFPAIKAGGVWQGETQLRHFKTGKPISVNMSSFLIRNPQTNEPICLATVSRDMTEQHKLQIQLRQSQKMEAVGQLAAGIAHDFNNILTVIQGHAGLLLGNPDLDDNAIASCKQISVSAERAANLVRQLLAFSHKQIMVSQLLDLNEVVSGVIKMLHRVLGENITLNFQPGPHLRPVRADAGMMEQVMMNLAVNARDAMPKGGNLVINTRAQEIDAAYVQQNPEAQAGDFVCLSVSDTGCGMDAETLSHIFEPFFTTKEVGRGTGLGLSTVYGIVKQHQGWVEATSEPGQGALFKIFLPASSEGAEPLLDKTTPPAPPAARGGLETVLVVEDETPLRVLVRNVLKRYGYQVLEAESGVEALQIWLQQRGQIDLLLTDMVMPGGISGRELAEKLRAEKPPLRVIYTSGYSADLVGEGTLQLDGSNFLQKPFDASRLARMVRESLDLGRSKADGKG